MAEWGVSRFQLGKTIFQLGSLDGQLRLSDVRYDVIAGQGLRYAFFVEHGHAPGGGREPEPFMRSSADTVVSQEFGPIAEDVLDEAVQGGFDEEDIIDAIASRLADEIAELARDRVPVDTGDLKDSIHVEQMA